MWSGGNQGGGADVLAEVAVRTKVSHVEIRLGLQIGLRTVGLRKQS